MRCLLADSNMFVIKYNTRKLLEVDRYDNNVIVEDWSDAVVNWKNFKPIIWSEDFDMLFLTTRDDNKLVFHNIASARMTDPYVDANLVIAPNNGEGLGGKLMKHKEEKAELELEFERIEKEKAELETKLKEKQIYEEALSSAKDVKTIFNAFVDVGFTREETMQLILNLGLRSRRSSYR